MGRRARFRGAKATPKSLEKDLLEKSKMLAERPALLMPTCQGECRSCDFKKAVAKMEKVSKLRYDPKKLDFSMKWGDQLVRAYAATISLYLAGKVPYLAASRTPVGEVSFAVRGKVDRDKLIGVQHYDHPQLRLMALWKTAQKRDLHLYSTEDKVICSPDGPKPPKEYVDEMAAQCGYSLADDYCCPHPHADQVLRVSWVSPGITFAICSSCAQETNLVHQLVGRIAARDPTDDFEVEVSCKLECSSSCPRCRVKEASLVSKELRKRYLSGELGDAVLLEEYERDRLSSIRKEEDEVYILGDRCFGKDKRKFMETLRGNEVEKEAISGLINSRKVCIISPSDQAANLLSDLWGEHKEDLLSKVASEEVVEALLKHPGELTPSQQLMEARRMERTKAIESTLPRYAKLGPVGKYADLLARVHKTDGKEAMLRQIEKGKGSEHKLRSVSFAFLSALGEGQSRAWQFTREERDFGTYLSDFAKKLLGEKGDGYHEALRLLVTASGSVEEMQRS